MSQYQAFKYYSNCYTLLCSFRDGFLTIDLFQSLKSVCLSNGLTLNLTLRGVAVEIHHESIS